MKENEEEEMKDNEKYKKGKNGVEKWIIEGGEIGGE